MPLWFVIPDDYAGGDEAMQFVNAKTPEEALATACNEMELEATMTSLPVHPDKSPQQNIWRVWLAQPVPGPCPGVVPWDEMGETRWRAKYA